MPASAGRDAVFSAYNGSSYITVGGMRTRALKFDETNVDVTTADSSGRWTEMLNGAGVRTCSLDGAGIYQRDAGLKLLVAAYNNGSLIVCRFAWPTAGLQVDASFLIDSFGWDAPYNDSGTFNVKLTSSGPVTLALT